MSVCVYARASMRVCEWLNDEQRAACNGISGERQGNKLVGQPTRSSRIIARDCRAWRNKQIIFNETFHGFARLSFTRETVSTPRTDGNRFVRVPEIRSVGYDGSARLRCDGTCKVRRLGRLNVLCGAPVRRIPLALHFASHVALHPSAPSLMRSRQL